MSGPTVFFSTEWADTGVAVDTWACMHCAGNLSDGHSVHLREMYGSYRGSRPCKSCSLASYCATLSHIRFL